MGTKMDAGFQTLGAKIDSFHSDMDLRFDRLDEKYGIFGKLLEQLIVSNLKLQEQNQEILRHILVVIDELRLSRAPMP